MEARRCAEKPPWEDAFASLLLEDVKHRLLQAFRGQRGPPPQRPRAAESQGGGSRRAAAAQEELRRAHLEGALAWLRVELLEMKSQNRKLAKTLLDLSMEIQRLRNETDMSAAVESKTLSILASPEK